MGTPDRIQFFVTNPHPCSYLDNQLATSLFADPYTEMTLDTFAMLTELGFRRSGEFIYKPQCANCSACIPVRVKINEFTSSRSQKRIINKNLDLHVQIDSPAFREKDYQLYEDYINTKHSDGGMHPPSHDQYQSFLMSSWSNSQFIRFFDKDQLICVAVVDRLPHGLSAVYTFYNPSFEKRSLGTYAVLWQIQHCRSIGVSHLYLGYWITNCRKMAYKNQFKPIEQLKNDVWVTAT